MLFNPAHEHRFVQRANVRPDPANLVGAVLDRLPAPRSAGTRQRVEGLLKVGAWTDAALALVECELPGWQLRRLVYEDGEWLCSLSRQPHMPCDLDDTADACHESATLAIWNAVLEASGRAATETKTSLPPALRIRQAPDCIVCCDNFA